MRKYFLLSAVALMISSTAFATTDYAEVTAKATIEVAGTFECDDLDWGTIVVKQNNSEFTLMYADEPIGDVISPGNDGAVASCSYDFDEEVVIDDVVLTSEKGDEITMGCIGASGSAIFSQCVHIPSNVKSGNYTGSFTVTITQ